MILDDAEKSRRLGTIIGPVINFDGESYQTVDSVHTIAEFGPAKSFSVTDTRCCIGRSTD